ncbi:hypothetical protein BKA62DRAFT_318583 [Auriculariales sp. MPI-PUGE-AT-0066]|nr:hypothetical protein BKA62DRAFT_318583 [Auriculariales sp. MPI-PUGE-AT-0066]
MPKYPRDMQRSRQKHMACSSPGSTESVMPDLSTSSNTIISPTSSVSPSPAPDYTPTMRGHGPKYEPIDVTGRVDGVLTIICDGSDTFTEASPLDLRGLGCEDIKIAKLRGQVMRCPVEGCEVQTNLKKHLATASHKKKVKLPIVRTCSNCCVSLSNWDAVDNHTQDNPACKNHLEAWLRARGFSYHQYRTSAYTGPIPSVTTANLLKRSTSSGLDKEFKAYRLEHWTDFDGIAATARKIQKGLYPRSVAHRSAQSVCTPLFGQSN